MFKISSIYNLRIFFKKKVKLKKKEKSKIAKTSFMNSNHNVTFNYFLSKALSSLFEAVLTMQNHFFPFLVSHSESPLIPLRNCKKNAGGVKGSSNREERTETCWEARRAQRVHVHKHKTMKTPSTILFCFIIHSLHSF